MGGVLGEGVSGVGLDVGFLCDAWPHAGAEALARGLMTRGHRVHVLCVERDGSLTAWKTADGEREGVAVRRMGAAAAPRALADLVHDARATDVVLAWMAEVPCDVIHALQTGALSPSALQAVTDMGRPLVGERGDPGLLCACARPLHEAHDVLDCARRHWPQLLPSGGGEARGPNGEPLADDAAAVRALVDRASELAQLVQRVVEPHAGAEAQPERMLEHERLYAALVLAVTGRLPRLAHAIPGVTPEPERAAPEPEARAGLLGRLFGRPRRP